MNTNTNTNLLELAGANVYLYETYGDRHFGSWFAVIKFNGELKWVFEPTKSLDEFDHDDVNYERFRDLLYNASSSTKELASTLSSCIDVSSDDKDSFLKDWKNFLSDKK